ncbi:hypothetical protein PPL_03948 [Heterostelium album PN500]|uniref:Uncharacterized protein n=1 Tax=Heterostelium pallidum (strain ATCC 26659 / Pp 5 / PN500) TaxID=670386 RepID=D3B5L0_HETP5|nr:hypothetical protein PPL_03948 [Heterostelium album PN500]EFA83158.1 hypothetical protein PPL_03948 [Heterostelium album PN500]|eukprot:XP_020435275.1 hypothetical protein PPL_03948 [Heterostelium album PN500]
MKFGKQLRYECVSEWRSKYISYGKLKKYLRYLYTPVTSKTPPDELRKRSLLNSGKNAPNYIIVPVGDESQPMMSTQFPNIHPDQPQHQQQPQPQQQQQPQQLQHQQPQQQQPQQQQPPNVVHDQQQHQQHLQQLQHLQQQQQQQQHPHGQILDGVDSRHSSLGRIDMKEVMQADDTHTFLSKADKEKLFFNKLNEELKKINDFFISKEKDLIIHYNKLTEHASMILKDQNPNPKLLKNIHRAFLELYQGLTMLENYVRLNHTGFTKILKKFDRHTCKSIREAHMALIEKETFYSSKIWKNMKEDVEIFKIDKLTTARHKLRPVSMSNSTDWHMMKLGLAIGSSLAALAFLIILFISGAVGSDPDWGRFVSVVPIFRGVGIPILAVWLWGVCVFIWEKQRVNYILIFGFDPRTTVDSRPLFLGDVLTSMVKTIFDWEYTACYFFTGDWITNDGARCNKVNNIALPIISGLPLLWRMMQCALVYKATKRKIHLGNTTKYGVGFTVVLFSALNGNYSNYPEPWTPGRILWCICFILATLYMYTWDVLVDWRLMWMGTPRPLLRQHLIYKRYIWAYYYVIFSNFIFRFAWTLTITPLEFNIGINNELFVTILATVEIFRRFTWAIFRVENEHVQNSLQYHAFDLSSAPWSDELKKSMEPIDISSTNATTPANTATEGVQEFANSSKNWMYSANKYYSKDNSWLQTIKNKLFKRKVNPESESLINRDSSE